jgi:hypothetical protein
MKKIKINKEKLYSLYMEEVNRISDLFEDKSYFSAQDLIGIVSDILEKNPKLITENNI